MKCARCEKEFLFEFLSVQQWLRPSKLENRQLLFLIFNFGGQHCSEYGGNMQSGFYLSGVNPYRKNLKASK